MANHGDEEKVLKTPYLRGYRRLSLIRDLAEGKMTRATIAEKYGIAEPTLYHFQKTHAAAIQEVRENFEDELAGLWAAKKANRVAEYQTIAEQSAALVESDPANERVATHQKVRIQALRTIAEEMGALPQRMQVQASVDPVRVEVVGVNTEDLT